MFKHFKCFICKLKMNVVFCVFLLINFFKNCTELDYSSKEFNFFERKMIHNL